MANTYKPSADELLYELFPAQVSFFYLYSLHIADYFFWGMNELVTYRRQTTQLVISAKMLS